MSIFSKILSKLGFGHQDEAAASPAPAATPTTAATAPAPNVQAPPAAAAPRPTSAVDVTAQLEQLARDSAEKLNWRTSIVDLLKLLGLDSSLAARKELATELHCPVDKMADSAQMNMWLHKTVLQKLAANGGKVPAELL